MNNLKGARLKLFLKLEAQYFFGSVIAGVIGLLAYNQSVGLTFLWLFFVLMQPFLINEYLKRR